MIGRITDFRSGHQRQGVASPALPRPIDPPQVPNIDLRGDRRRPLANPRLVTPKGQVRRAPAAACGCTDAQGNARGRRCRERHHRRRDHDQSPDGHQTRAEKTRDERPNAGTQGRPRVKLRSARAPRRKAPSIKSNTDVAAALVGSRSRPTATDDDSADGFNRRGSSHSSRTTISMSSNRQMRSKKWSCCPPNPTTLPPRA